MGTLLIAVGAGLAFLVAYHTYGRWLGSKIFDVSASFVCPSHRLRDNKDYVPTSKSIVFGHHFTSIAGTGPIVGPAIAVMWGWVPALLWVVLGSIFIGAVHDFGSLVVSLRNNGQTVGDIAGRVLNKRVRLLFLVVLFLALMIVLAIFGLVIANVFKQYPSAIFPCLVQVPIAVGIGFWLHRKGAHLLVPSLLALALMYLTVIFGDQNTPVAQMPWLPGWLAASIGAIESALHDFNSYMASLSVITWVAILLVYSYVASVLPVWTLLQPRDYINSLQLVSALGLIVAGLCYAAFAGGAPPVDGAARQPLEIVAPAFKWDPAGAPLIFPFLFITIACGAISGFHCLVSSGTSSKQLEREPDARFVGYGGMLMEGFLATLVILACVAGLGLGWQLDRAQVIGGNGYFVFPMPFAANTSRPMVSTYRDQKDGPLKAMKDWVPVPENKSYWGGGESETLAVRGENARYVDDLNLVFSPSGDAAAVISTTAWQGRYQSWGAAGGLANTVSAFVDGSANFLKAMKIPGGIAIALMGVLVASFAGTTMDTACRLQRYVIQELAATFGKERGPRDCPQCGYNLHGNVSGTCPECGWEIDPAVIEQKAPDTPPEAGLRLNPLTWLRNKHGATIFAVITAFIIAAMPAPGSEWSWANAGKGGLILWPMFGATNQLLGGLAFLVIAFYLWRRKKPIWFLVPPLVFMLVMPAWAMCYLIPEWLAGDSGGSRNWALIVIGTVTILLEVWMVIEAVLLLPRVRGILERELPGSSPTAPGSMPQPETV